MSPTSDNKKELMKQVGTMKDLVETALKKLLTLKSDEVGAWIGENKDLLVHRSCTDNWAIQLNQHLDVTPRCSPGCYFSPNCSSFHLQGMGAICPADG